MSGGGLMLPPAGGGISDQTVAFAAGLTDRSGKAPVIEAALAHATGRPRPLPVRAVLTALLCLALEDRPLFLTEATRLLFQHMSPASRRLPGVPGTVSGGRAFRAACRRVRYCFGAICSVMDPSVLPKNRRLTGQDLTARTRKMTPAQIQAARSRLEAFINALIEAGVSVLADEERAAFDGCTALDATPVPLFSRGPSRRTGLCASDPGGGWYVREGDHREREDDKGKPLRKIARALEATIATTARPPGAPPWPGPAKTPAAPAPGSWPLPPPAGTRPAGPATTVPAPLRSPGDSGCQHAPWATGPSWTTGSTSPASRQTPAEPSSWREPGTAPPCPGRSSAPPPACATTPSPASSTTSRSPPAAPASSSAKTARTPTATSACPAPPPATIPR